MRQATHDAHAELDMRLSHCPTGSDRDYADFLLIQYLARQPVENWCRAHCPPELLPPVQTDLLLHDLRELGRAVPLRPDASLDAPAGVGALGVAWVLAGASLGNRALLARRRKAGGSGADRFLSDPAMTEFWQRLLPRIAGTMPIAGLDIAARAASAVFALFLSTAGSVTMRQAA